MSLHTRLRPPLLALAFSLTLLPAGAWAQVQLLSAMGSAPVVEGDSRSAREAAIRDALAEISRQSAVDVRSTTTVMHGQVTEERTTLRSQLRIRRHQVVHEAHEGDLYRVLVEAEVVPPDFSAQAASRCDSPLVRRVLVGGFPLRRPDELLQHELHGYARLTASEIAQRFAADAPLLVDHKGSLMLRLSLPEHVEADVLLDEQAWTRVREAAAAHRAQYVLVGQFRSFALNPSQNRRNLELDVLLLDAYSASCVARTRLQETASGRVVVPAGTRFGSPEHYATGLGRAYLKLIEQASAWASTQARCQPFGVRVVSTEGERIHLDAGAEQGLQNGDMLMVTRQGSTPIVTPQGEILGQEQYRLGEARITAVYPRFSVAEMVDRRFMPGVGDTLYAE